MPLIGKNSEAMSKFLRRNAGLDEEAGIKIAKRNIKNQYHH